MPSKINSKKFYEEYICIYEGDVFRFAYSLVKNKEDASDIRQNVMFRSWKYLHTLKEPEKAKNWLLSITYRETMRFLKKRKKENLNRYMPLEDISDPVMEIPDSADGALAELIKLDDIEIIKEAFSRLTYEEQNLIQLRYVDEIEPSEIGRMYHVKANTVRSALCRALKKLRVRFDEIDRKGDIDE